ncbi:MULTISPECIES: CDP-diacylglycerol--glycerol-3-phosphate 3-phosphatidyltransferase [Eubacterium]|uniref:CDP-diacylglycerol--glycerol-3-phosphate 3-phosphatidyltransferase n=1 Tax=Eubacterium barkeri TaxID=1528 RepID=A0A1H3HSX2_EUBBA|nr:CDP-diacylglycerol--glycerol-3-phosphate 3-phosphatidyltransferase [Eubacterium barkeri]SDY18510.1 CDP-diacylglycerol--glycerol-3-phosphate 3-phosphatidyltransferase [Eubacterium barkeri]
MNLPNKITMARIIMIPFFVIAMAVDFPFHEPIALVLFVVAAASDALDGHLARSRNLVTDFGKFMDPLADKLLVCSAFICLVELHLMPAWVVIVIIAREFAITGLRTLAASDGVVIAASKWGKAKTMSQMIAIVALLLYNWPVCQIPALNIFGTVMIYVALVLTLISGIDYFRLNKGVIKSY